MGLDITAYSRLKLSPLDVYQLMEDDDEWSPWDEGLIQGAAYARFANSTRGLQGHDQPTPNDPNWIGTCWYVETAATETHDFRAGSYGGYGMWRNDLATFSLTMLRAGITDGLVPIDEHLRVPFIELTYFADNEGCIGPEAAADLLKDFRQFETVYKSNHDADDIESYGDWMRACELAADGGLIQFH